MKKALAWLLVLAMTAALAVGGTLAYLTDTDEDVNVMTVGQVKIDQLEYERVDVESADDEAEVQEFHDNKPLYPAVTEDGFDWTTGDSYVDWEQIGKDNYTSEIWDPTKINNEVDKMVFVKNKGDWDAYVRTVFAFEAGSYTDLDAYLADVHLNLNDTDWTWEWVETPITIGDGTYFVATATYNKVLEPGKLTEISLSQIALDSSVTNEDVAGFGDTFQVLVQSQAVQADGFADAPTALEEAFGVIPPEYPFENDNPTKGIDLRKALHYYEGGSTQISSKVSNVVFGLNKDYTAIIDEYDGTLVDVDQDVPVYAYYVPNGSNYDVYFLASDDIYLPEDSSSLFIRMSELVSLDSSNMNTSRVVNMMDMFYRCGKLQSIDPTGWDVSNVQVLYGTFCRCTSLTSIDLTGWDTSSVTDMRDVFSNSNNLVTIKGLETWDTSNVTRMESMFSTCRSLTDLSGITNWDTSKVTSLYQTFQMMDSLTELNIANWDTSSLTDLHFTFKGTDNIVELDLSGWDTSKVTTFSSLFSSEGSNNPDMKLKVVKIENWDTSSCETFAYMFYGCGQLEEIDLSGWDASKVTSVYHMFADCSNLKSVNFSGWETSSLTNMDGMFNDCRSLVTVDVSDLDTGNVEDMSQLFEACVSLKEIKGLENWDMSKVWDYDQMFLNCFSLEAVDLSAWDTSGATSTGMMFQSCTSLKTIYVGDGWDMSGVTSSGSMFNNCPSLVGQNGTTTSGNPIDVTYARVDTAEEPGYLTYKAAP